MFVLQNSVAILPFLWICNDVHCFLLLPNTQILPCSNLFFCSIFDYRIYTLKGIVLLLFFSAVLSTTASTLQTFHYIDTFQRAAHMRHETKALSASAFPSLICSWWTSYFLCFFDRTFDVGVYDIRI